MDDAVPHFQPWVILGRIPRRVPGGAQQAAGVAVAGAGAAGHAADFSFPLVPPPRVTVMNAGPSADPDPNNPDMYPYVLGAESGILLLNFGVKPFYGACLGERPYQSNLIVVRDFDAAGVAQGHPPTGTAERIVPRDGKHAVVTNIESVGLLSDPVQDAVDRFFIAELLINKGSDTARLVYFFADDDKWIQEDAPNPLFVQDQDREWVPSGVISHIDMLWWFDLSWGLISFDHMAGDEVVGAHHLLFHALPEGRDLGMAQPGIHNTRCIAESNGELLFVEIITDPDGDAEAARVCVWTRTSGDDNVTIGWDVEHDVFFHEIWNHDSYIQTGLPRKVPLLVAVSPVNVDHVYFVLQEEERLFCADLLMRTVADFVDEDYDLVAPWPMPPACRFVLPWFLPEQVAQALVPVGNLDNEELVVDVTEEMTNKEEEVQAEENQEDEELAVEIDVALQEGVADEMQQLIAEAQVVFQALAQAQAPLEAPADNEELQEAEIDEEEEPEEEIHDDETSSEEMLQLDRNLAVRMDRETASRLKAEVKEHLSGMEDRPGPSQDPRDDAGEGAV